MLQEHDAAARAALPDARQPEYSLSRSTYIYLNIYGPRPSRVAIDGSVLSITHLEIIRVFAK